MPNYDNQRSQYWYPLVIGLAAALGLLAGYNMNFENAKHSLFSFTEESSNTISVNGDGRIEEILRFVETKYVDSIETDKITLQLIDELLDQLDPHSSYISPEELADHNERMKGEYRGIGIETLTYQDTFYLTRLMETGPAKKAGLSVGDAILSVNGQAVSGVEMPISEVRAMLKDSLNDALEVEVLSLGNTLPKTVELASDIIEVPSADVCYMLDDEIAYLKLSRFSANTYEQFIEAIESIKKGKTKLSLVLDLRDNPGGYLPEAIKILSQLFDSKDKLLTYTEGLNRKRRDYRSTGNAFYNIDKIAVLIDGYSASGSEILSGAVQDWDRGIVIGETSYGKGLVQEIFNLRNGGALRLTVAKYYTPSGRLIQRSYSSESNEFSADSSVHLTKVLEREMDSGNGIVPDRIVKETNCYEYQYYFDQYLIETMKQQGTLDLVITDFTEAAYRSFVKTQFEESFENISPSCIAGFNKAAFLRYKQMILTDTAYAKYANLSDKHVKVALDFINDKRETLALLSEEE